MGLLSGLLNTARIATPLAAAARSGYMTGQDDRAQRDQATARLDRAERRQTLLDRMRQNTDAATIERDHAATDLARAQAAKLDDPDWQNVTGADTPTIFERHSGQSKTVGATKQKGFHSFNQYNPESGMMEDIADDGTRVPRRKATMIEKMKFNHVPAEPRDPNTPAPMNDNATEDYLSGVALDAVRGSGGDERKAAESLLNDPRGMKAYSKGLATRHFMAAKSKYSAEQERLKRGATDDLSSIMDKYGNGATPAASATSAPATAAPVRTPAARPAARTGSAPSKTTITQDQYEYLVTPTEQGGRGMTPDEVRTKYTIKG